MEWQRVNVANWAETGVGKNTNVTSRNLTSIQPAHYKAHVNRRIVFGRCVKSRPNWFKANICTICRYGSALLNFNRSTHINSSEHGRSGVSLGNFQSFALINFGLFSLSARATFKN
ncbi:hypothetical protein SPHINGO391_480088 [Sphingomonas aurantiaca]|uniref:Uncharacterized protein n=1 Tax=Sphingomonas aurantiaca TaxID=185949 RepID=A0A5E8A4B9_9SPHN|nr:hypothetical protein SPHINGO391_480088 [Sphingomonas aurantiaca]